MWVYLRSAVVMTLVYSAFGSECPSSENAEKKFKVFEEKVNWFGAVLNCGRQRMSLATIESQEEQDRLADLLKGSSPDTINRWWIGGSDLHEYGEFIWFSTGELIKYKNFLENRPNNWNGKEDCLEVLSGYKSEAWNYEWNDCECNLRQFYICECYDC